MLKKFFIAVILVLSLATLSSCGKEEKSKKPQVSEEGMLSIENYMVSLTDKKISHLKETRKLLDHPFKDAIALYGDDYEIFWEGVYVTMQSKGAQCGFRTYVGLEFEEYSWDDVITDFGNCDVMEYLSFREVERIIFDQKGFALTDGITIGMSVEEICHKLKVEGLEYSDSSTYITTEIDDNGDEIEIYTICTQIADVECSVIFKGDVLSSVEILNPSKYVMGSCSLPFSVWPTYWRVFASCKPTSFRV